MNLYSSEIPADRADVLHSKYLYGMWFGVVIGLTFSIFAWGVDAYKLTQINGLHPWLKFLVGVLAFCTNRQATPGIAFLGNRCVCFCMARGQFASTDYTSYIKSYRTWYSGFTSLHLL